MAAKSESVAIGRAEGVARKAEGEASFYSTAGLARLAGVSSAYIRQLKAAGKLPDPSELLSDGAKLFPIWDAATAHAWASDRKG